MVDFGAVHVSFVPTTDETTIAAADVADDIARKSQRGYWLDFQNVFSKVKKIHQQRQPKQRRRTSPLTRSKPDDLHGAPAGDAAYLVQAGSRPLVQHLLRRAFYPLRVRRHAFLGEAAVRLLLPASEGHPKVSNLPLLFPGVEEGVQRAGGRGMLALGVLLSRGVCG